MAYKKQTMFCMFVFLMAFSGITRADNDNTITFVNSTGRVVWVAFWGNSECISSPPQTGARAISIDGFRQSPLNITPGCGDASIQFKLTMSTDNNEYPDVGGTVTYRKYKGTNNKWLQKIEFVPTAGVNFFNFMRATCGASQQPCKGMGIPFTNTQAAVVLLNPGLSASPILRSDRRCWRWRC